MIVITTPEGLEIQAPAKLNLFLEVHGRRPDGYHELESLMVTVDEPKDVLIFTKEDSSRITLHCDDPTLPTGSDNLVVKAAEALRSESGTRFGARIDLRKAIPTQAGLAGGSSDAASTLTGLDLLWNLNTDSARLDELAASIGSDVTFFRHEPAAICRGRGERVESVPLTRSFSFVLVCPPVGMSTRDVYGRLTPPDRPRPIEPFVQALALGETRAIGQQLFNRLQPIAESLCPALTEVRDALADCPSLDGFLMSGSGSAYFGLAASHDAAEDAAARLATLGLGRVRVVTSRP